VQVDKCGPAAGVTHALHQLAKTGARLGDEVVAGVPEIVEVHAREAGCGDGRDPISVAERSGNRPDATVAVKGQTVQRAWLASTRRPPINSLPPAPCPTFALCDTRGAEDRTCTSMSLADGKLGHMSPTAIDLFCGAGGASLGLMRSGWDVRLATDVDLTCAMTHRANLDCEFLTADLRTVDSDKVMAAAGVSLGQLDLLFAGPPCQGFSIIGSRVVWDERNNLFKEVLRLASEMQPRCVVIENVPGLATLARGSYLHAILEGLSSAGYEAACAELLAAQYGAPQMRWRLIIIAWRHGLGIPAGYGFPSPSAGMAKIGDLLPNCTIPSWQLEGFVTTAEAIRDLPPVAAGEEMMHYLGPPVTPYQKAMRAGLNGELSNHYAARLSAINLARLAHIKPGQDWRDLPHELLPSGMQRALRKDHTRRYRRMTWNGVPRAVITRFRDPKSGEYTHPEQDRTITIREAARLQGFPDSFVFHGDRTSQYEQVGNAVPAQLSEAIASEIRHCLSGQLGERLRAPFRRRPIAFLGTHGELTPGLLGLSEVMATRRAELES
jgi:DNA (cytosine-5)-methyltransferase 1